MAHAYWGQIKACSCFTEFQALLSKLELSNITFCELFQARNSWMKAFLCFLCCVGAKKVLEDPLLAKKYQTLSFQAFVGVNLLMLEQVDLTRSGILCHFLFN